MWDRESDPTIALAQMLLYLGAVLVAVAVTVAIVLSFVL